jgi:hypothetical protein
MSNIVKEPIYKITFILPELEIDDSEYDNENKYHISCVKKIVIWNESTYFEIMKNNNHIKCDIEKKECWLNIIDSTKNFHCSHSFGYEKTHEKWITVNKLSVELLN